MNPEKFLIRIINRYELVKWAQIGFENMSMSSSNISSTATQDELSKILVQLAEEMFYLIIVILNERFVLNVSECTQVEILQREIIHFLCTGPKPFSQIEKVVLLNFFKAKIVYLDCTQFTNHSANFYTQYNK